MCTDVVVQCSVGKVGEKWVGFSLGGAVRTQVTLKRTGNVSGVLQVNATNRLPGLCMGVYKCFLCDCTDLTKPVVYGQALCWVVKQYYRHM